MLIRSTTDFNFFLSMNIEPVQLQAEIMKITETVVRKAVSPVEKTFATTPTKEK
jgi:hypothetical protein